MPKAKRQSAVRDAESLDVLARQGLRYRMLRLIHELAEGQIERRIPAHVLRSREGISMTTLEQVLSYLRDEKLIDAPRHDFHSVSLRHKGLVEVERAILNPSAGTEHFDPKVTAAYRRDPTGRTRTMRIVGPDVG